MILLVNLPTAGGETVEFLITVVYIRYVISVIYFNFVLCIQIHLFILLGGDVRLDRVDVGFSFSLFLRE